MNRREGQVLNVTFNNAHTFYRLVACFHDSVNNRFHMPPKSLAFAISKISGRSCYTYGIAAAELQRKSRNDPFNFHLDSKSVW